MRIEKGLGSSPEALPTFTGSTEEEMSRKKIGFFVLFAQFSA